MGALFAIVVVPTGVILRLTGKDPLRLKLDRTARDHLLAAAQIPGSGARPRSNRRNR